MALRFRFELDSTPDIQAWGEQGQMELHWFGLTSGRFWIETPVGEVLRYTAAIQELWSFPFDYVDYQVARLFEDLQSCISAALEPVPEDIGLIVSDPVWLEKLNRWIEEEIDEAELDQRWDLYESAVSWWQHRMFDTLYLKHGPLFSIWRINDVVHFRWVTGNNEADGVSVFLIPTGEITVSIEDFKAAAFGFCEEVLLSMSERVRQIQMVGWNRTDCSVDVDVLVSEQRKREDKFHALKNHVLATDWNYIRTQLALLVAHVYRT
jgi:hypothetical protein